MDDQRIISLYFKRDEQAIADTAQKYGKYCFSVAKNILPNEQDCEECVNDTYNKAWNSIPPQSPVNFKLFLAKITRNLALDKLKYESRQKRGLGESVLALEEIGEIVSDGESIMDALEKKALSEAINRFLRAIPERDCDIFVSRYFYIESTKKIAQKYSLSHSNVLKILSRTRIKLREYLISEGYDI